MVNKTEAFRIAFAHYQAGRVREAEVIFRQILEIDPSHAESVHLLGLVSHQLGRQDSAILLLNQAVMLRGDVAAYHSNLGTIYRAVGRLSEAEACLRRALQLDPKLADAHYNLGKVLRSLGQHAGAVAAFQRTIQLEPNFAEPYNELGSLLRAQNDLPAAVNYFERALALNPRNATAHTNLSGVYSAQGRLDEAIESYQKALGLAGESAEGRHNLGVLYLAHQQYDQAIDCFRSAILQNPDLVRGHLQLGAALRLAGRLDEAIAALRESSARIPDDAQVHLSLGAVFHEERQYEQAIVSIREALRLNPMLAMAHINLGGALRGLGRTDEAIASFRQAITIEPGLAENHFNLAAVFHELRDWPAAVASYRDALQVNPKFAEAMVSLAQIRQLQNLLDEAQELYDQAVELRPELIAARVGRAGLYRHKGLPDEAIAEYRAAISLRPDFSDSYIGLGSLFNELERSDESIECSQQGLAQCPESAPLMGVLASGLRLQGRLAEAIAWRRKSLQLDPHNPNEHSKLLNDLNADPTADPPAVFAEHQEWARRHAEPLTAAAARPKGERGERRLRIGYISAHFRQHPLNYWFEPMLVSQDRTAFESFCYSDTRVTDRVTARIRAAADYWRDTRIWTDEQLAQAIRDDKIDLLVDLAGHSAGNRLLAFARAPAPVQVSYLGYVNTTGMSAIDTRITDGQTDVPGLTEAYNTEQLVRLPRNFFCYQPAADPPATPLPAMANGHVTFGSFNRFEKVTPPMIEAWLEILQRVANSRLLVLARRGGYVEQHLRELARARQVDPERLEVFDRVPRSEFVRQVQRADVALDTFPLAGRVTTCDTLWQGVPVVSLAGETHASRFAVGVLEHVDLEGCLATSVAEYVQRAVELAGDLPALARLRSELRPRLVRSPLLDFKGFTRTLEQAYRELWQRRVS